MSWYCEKCKTIHTDEQLCPHIQEQLRKTPQLLSEAANFASVAGQYDLITSQRLDSVAQAVNKVAGTNLSYEGTHQYARDIQVFKRINEEARKRAGYFSSPDKAKAYLEEIINSGSDGTMRSFDSMLTGSSQEVDWLRMQQGKLSSIWKKSVLLNDNAPGIDGITYNRFNNGTVSRVTIKASKDAGTRTGGNIQSNVNKVGEAIEKGRVTNKDVIYGVEGTADAAKKAGLSNPVVEQNTPKQVSDSNSRLKRKVLDGKAVTSPTAPQVLEKMGQGAVVGAVVSLGISTLTNYIRYRNGELTREEAFRDVGEDTTKGALIGGAMAGVTIFIPGGAIGFVGGMAIGMYLNASLTNVLDEVYGKGAYLQLLHASGYIMGTSMNLMDAYQEFSANTQQVNQTLVETEGLQSETNATLGALRKMRGN